MRIAMLNNYYYLRGGSERVFFNEIELLEKHGHIVGVFSRNHQENFPSKYTSFFPPDIQTDKVRFNLSAIKLISEIIYSKTNKNLFENFLNYFKPDIIHAHNIYGRITTSVLDAGKKYSLPIVMTLH
ncbi:MAG: glycosyltransferase family 1 protein, partial [Candidatus Thorarchaeota archaeon]